MQRVLKKIFFIDEKEENSLKFWTLLGPFFLFLSVILASFDLAVLAAISLFLCYRFKFVGLFFSLIALTIFSLYTQVNLAENHLWNLGLEISIALSLIITAVSLDEIKTFVTNKKTHNRQELLDLQNQIHENQTAFENAQKNYQDQISQLSDEIEKKAEKLKQSYLENDKLKNLQSENSQKKDYLLNELDQKVKETEEFQIKLDDLYEKLSFLKDEEFLHERNKTYQNEIETLKIQLEKQAQEKENIFSKLQEKQQQIDNLEKELKTLNENQINSAANEKHLSELEEKTQTIASLEQSLKEYKDKCQNINDLQKQLIDAQNELKKLKQTKLNVLDTNAITDKDLLKEYDNKNKEFFKLNSLYVQLKDQFNEKQMVLHKTRQDLFHAQENLSALKKELNNDYKDLSDNEKSLMKDLDKTHQELKVYKQENQNLQDLISKFFEKNSSYNEDVIPQENTDQGESV